MYLWINNKSFSLWDANFFITEFICVSVSKACIKWIVVGREKFPDILQCTYKKEIIGEKTDPNAVIVPFYI